MYNIKNKVVVIAIFTLLWLFVNESFTPMSLALSVILCALSVYISGKLLEIDYAVEFAMPPLKAIKYILFMFYSVYMSGFRATYYILTGKVHPSFVKVKIDEKIENEFLQNIIANSVTLTPGTITVDKKGDMLTILCLHKDDTKSPISDFEPFMLDMQKSMSCEEKQNEM